MGMPRLRLFFRDAMMHQGFETTVPENTGQIRLDRFLAGELLGRGISRSRVKQWIKSGDVLVGQRVCTQPSALLHSGDRVRVRALPVVEEVTPEKGPIQVLYQDADLVVLDKPAGLTVHPAPSCPEGTLVHRLAHRFPAISDMPGARPGIVHRLDKDTSGLIVVALNEAARLSLSRDFAAREVHKVYLALVHGVPDPPRGTVTDPIGRDPRNPTRMAVVEKGGRTAHSSYETVWTAPGGGSSLLTVGISTGRTHQIRVHLSHRGHPLLGDTVYGAAAHARLQKDMPRVSRHARRQMLHAWRLSFDHPGTGKRLTFLQPPPRDFQRVALLLGRGVQRVGVTGMPGCGKSELVRRLEDLGAPVWLADETVATLYRPGADGQVLLKQRFGGRFLTQEGGVDKPALREAMLQSDTLRREVEQLVHPLVRHRLEVFFKEHRPDRLAVAEVPLLLESSWDKDRLFDVVVGVMAAEEKRHQWLRKSRGWSEELIARLESWQWSERDKLRQCDLVVVNPGTPEGLDREARRLFRVLQRLRRNRARRLLTRLSDIWTRMET